MSKPFKMKGNPAKTGGIQGTSGHTSALKDLGHGGHPGLTYEEAAARTHGGKMSKEDLKARQKANSKKQTGPHHKAKARDQELIERREARDKAGNTGTAKKATTKVIKNISKKLVKRKMSEKLTKKKPTDKEVWDNNIRGVRDKYDSFESYQEAAEKYRNR
jgi:hypothetical protein